MSLTQHTLIGVGVLFIIVATAGLIVEKAGLTSETVRVEPDVPQWSLDHKLQEAGLICLRSCASAGQVPTSIDGHLYVLMRAEAPDGCIKAVCSCTSPTDGENRVEAPRQ